MKLKPAVFLDRDGTLLNERGYLGDPARLYFYPSVFDGLKRLMKGGYRLVVVTNQSGVARGYFSLQQLGKVHERFKRLLREKGVKITGIYFCPHLPTAGCACRKPKPFLIRKAAREHGLDVKRSYVIGDQARDMTLARNAGATGILVLTGAGRSALATGRREATKVAANLFSAAKWILKEGHES